MEPVVPIPRNDPVTDFHATALRRMKREGAVWMARNFWPTDRFW
jgi:hypothetical protein